MIVIFASLMMVAGVVLIVIPAVIFGFLRNQSESTAIHAIAVMSRLIIGALLVAQSSLSRFPLEIEVLGWVLIFVGLSLAIIGRNNFRKLMSLLLARFHSLGRFAGIVAVAFGGFLVYAFL